MSNVLLCLLNSKFNVLSSSVTIYGHIRFERILINPFKLLVEIIYGRDFDIISYLKEIRYLENHHKTERKFDCYFHLLMFYSL